VVTVSLYDKKEEAVLQGACDLCRRYENLFSKTLSGSDIDRVNRAQGQPVSVEAETAGLIEQGLHYHELSNGAFDITAAL
jgi:thiamine biosynthesis lipoprotein